MKNTVIMFSSYIHDYNYLNDHLESEYNLVHVEASDALFKWLDDHVDTSKQLGQRKIILVLSSQIEDASFLDILIQVEKRYRAAVPSLVYSPNGVLKEAVEAIRYGAIDYVVNSGGYEALIQSIYNASDKLVSSLGARNANEQDILHYSRELVFEVLDHFSDLDDRMQVIQSKVDDWLTISTQSCEVPKVLVIEDEVQYLELLQDMISVDFDVEGVASGRAGIERVEQGGIDIVLLDLFLPDMDGVDVARELKTIHPECQIVVLSAFDFLDKAVDVLKEGAFDYINKPVLKEDLIIALKSAVRLFQMQTLKKEALSGVFYGQLTYEEKIYFLECIYEFKEHIGDFMMIKDFYCFFPKIKSMNMPDQMALPSTITKDKLFAFVQATHAKERSQNPNIVK